MLPAGEHDDPARGSRLSSATRNGLHAAITTLFADAGVTPHIAQRAVWLVQTVLGLVAAGIGWAVVPSSAAALHRNGVALRRLTDATQQLDLAAIWRPHTASAPLRGLLDIVEPKGEQGATGWTCPGSAARS